MAQAQVFYEQAIALHPQFASARSAYADYLVGRAAMGMTPAHDAMPAARVLAERALELDDSLPEAHAILCAFAATYDYNWKEAARQYTLATANDALSPWARSYCAQIYLLASGRRREALEQAESRRSGRSTPPWNTNGHSGLPGCDWPL